MYTSLVLTMDTCLLSARKAVMKSVYNKKDLIRVFSVSNCSDSVDVIGEENSAFKQEEAYCNIISYVLFLIHEQKKCIHIIAEDTIIFVLLVYFCWKWQAGVDITVKNCCDQVIDINATIAKLCYKCSQLLAVHTIAGCDTVSYMFGKGKVSAVTIIQKHDLKLDAFRDPRADLPDVLKAWT